MKKKYDVFVSYRREGGFESANLIAEKLRRMGYSVFFDVESLRSGRFNEQLYRVIEECKDFIIVLPKNGLDRCSNTDGSANEEDWIRKEAVHALQGGKNIIPVMLVGFEWPRSMPKGMEDLKEYQAVTAGSHEVFDLAMQRLSGYLKSKPNKHLLLKFIAGFIAVITVVFAVGYFMLLQIARPLCTSVANDYSISMGLVHEAREDEEALIKNWNDFLQNYSIAQSVQRKSDLEREILSVISHTKDNTLRLRNQIRPVMELSDWQIILLGLYGSQKEDILALPSFVGAYMEDIDSLVGIMGRIIDGRMYNPREVENVKLHAQFFEYSVNMIYYAYLQELTKLPKGCRKMHDSLCGQWTLFPNVSLSLPQSEYERLQKNELAKIDKITSKMEQIVAIQENENYELEQRLDTLEALARTVNEWVAPQTDNKAELLNAATERVNAKKELVEQKRAELTEETAKVKEVYERLKQNCMLKEEDSEGYQWGKIVRMAKFMSESVKNYRKFGDMTIIRPAIVYTDICTQLDEYLRFHPNAKTYIPALKQFYKQVSVGKFPLGGQLVFAFKDAVTHPMYKVGDIVVSRNGQNITDYDSMKRAISIDKQGTVEFYRLEAGTLILHKENVCETNTLVGFLEVGEY